MHHIKKSKSIFFFCVAVFTIITPELTAAEISVHGFIKPEFEAIRQTFLENFTERGDIGASCVVYYKDEKVVDIWGGNYVSGRNIPWEEDTRTVVFSATQGIASLAFVLAWNSGYFDYDDRIDKYWPAFASAERDGMTIRQLLNMQSGMVVWPKDIKRKDFFTLMNNPESLETELLRIKPLWKPGEATGYSTDIQGHLCSILFRKIDPYGRSIGTFIREEITDKLAAEFDLGLPQSFPDDKLSEVKLIIPISGIFNLHKVSDEMKEVLGDLGSLFYKTMTGPSGYDPNKRKSLEVEFVGANGVANARGLAMIYNAFLNSDIRLFDESDREPSILFKPVRSSEENVDKILNTPSKYHLGMQKPTDSFPFGSSAAFGFIGASGSFAYADPETGIAYAWVTNKMDFYSIDPRDIALRKTINEILKTISSEKP